MIGCIDSRSGAGIRLGSGFLVMMAIMTLAKIEESNAIA
jgi:hypothetical protein